MIKYLGSKRLLLGPILEAVAGFEGARTVADLFSGTSRVGHALKRAGYFVLANDHNAFAHTLARCYVQADADRLRAEAEKLIAELDRLPGRAGWFTETYCERSRFFQPHNGARIEAVREAIAAKSLDPVLEAVLLTSLMEAADRVDSTTGVQMAYLKSWAPRASAELHLRLPAILPGPGEANALDALEAARKLEADVAYVDPPYNQHSYLGNYHIWETLVRWDEPETYGVACKRVDVRERRSAFNGRRTMRDALRAVIAECRSRHLVVSFNDEGFVTRDELVEWLSERGEVRVADFDFKRYVGAKIGIHNPAGERVGTVGRLHNTERLFVV
ncbi:MAG TPA: DNA adenine methylase [Coriobacteriia bacterium]